MTPCAAVAIGDFGTTNSTAPGPFRGARRDPPIYLLADLEPDDADDIRLPQEVLEHPRDPVRLAARLVARRDLGHHDRARGDRA